MTPFTTTTHESATIARAGMGGTVAIVRRLKVQPGHPIADVAFVNDETWCWINGYDGSIVSKVPTPLSPGKPVWVKEEGCEWAGTYDDFVPRAGETEEEWANLLHDAAQGHWKHRPAITMPRWAARFTLTPETVRVCRVQEVGHDEAMKAGGEFIDGWHPVMGLSRKLFGPDSWNRNDWVMVALCKIGEPG